MKHRLKYAVLGIFLGLQAVALPAFADDAADLKAAKTAIEQQDYAAALKLIKPLAEKGNAEAQFNLGVIYKNKENCCTHHYMTISSSSSPILVAEGMTHDYTTAFKWFKLSADQGYAAAQYNLGVLYYEGKGVTQDEAEGVKWLKLAASQNTDLKIKQAAQKMLDKLAEYGIR